jgi:Zn-dependent metalloprotease
MALASLVVMAVVTATATATAATAAPVEPAADRAAAAADALVASDHAALRKSPDDMLVRTGVHPGTHGMRYFSYDRTYRGLPVIGGDLVVATDAAGAVRDVAVAQDRVISVDRAPRISAAAALATARSQLSTVRTSTAPRLAVLAWDTPRLVWEVKLTGTAPDSTETVPSIYIDASTGAVAGSVDLVRDGAGNGFYNGTVTIDTSGSGSSFAMSDPTRPNIRCGGQNGTTFTGSDDNWGNGSGTNLETACVDALYAAQQQWDMLDSWLGRDGINGNGSGFPARVGWDVVNASWNGSFANFGHSQDGQRQATPMDIVAHEFGHAIFQTTPGGVGSGRENGGLNEGTGDIFGTLTETFANNPNDPPDFLVGEEANLVGTGAIRDMADPSVKGHPNCWSTEIPNTEVHAAAGPLNHWFYLVSQGSNPPGGPSSPICPGGPSSVTGIGILKAGQIYYNALLMKTSTWRYSSVRLASLNATVNLFGASSAECATVKAAWNAVSVPVQSGEPSCGGTPPPPPPPPPPGTVFFDDFESNQGWVTDPNNNDTATTGVWERGDPQATSSGGVQLQLGNAVSGSNTLVTGAPAGSGAGSFDIDNGDTTVRSPSISLPSGSGLELTFSYFFAHLNNATSADYLRLFVLSSSGTTQVFQQLGAGVNRAGAWTGASVDLSSFAGQNIMLRFEAADGGGGSLIEAGIDDVRIAPSGGGGPGVVFSDNFESAQGWVTDPNNNDTATSGEWERANPQPTSNGGVALQLGDTVSGSNDLVTGATAGSSAGVEDIDNGDTTIRSPSISLPSGSGLELTFSYYFAHLNNATSADYLRLFVVTGSGTTQVFQQLGAGVNRAGVWTGATVNLSAFAGQTIQIQIEAADAGGGSLIEAGIDDVVVTAG